MGRRIELCGLRREVYPGVDHGFAFPDRATRHQAAERHRARLLDLLNRALAPHQDDWTRQALGASRAPWLHRQGADARRELGCAEPHGELHLLSKVREWPEYASDTPNPRMDLGPSTTP